MKQKKMVALGLGLLTLILVVLPLISALPPMWKCSDIGCPGSGGCSGDVMSWVGCIMTCKTGSTAISVDCSQQ